MKKILVLILSLVFCICSAFAIACGGDVNIDGNINVNGGGNTNEDNGGNDNTDDGNEDNGGNNGGNSGNEDNGGNAPSIGDDDNNQDVNPKPGTGDNEGDDVVGSPEQNGYIGVYKIKNIRIEGRDYAIGDTVPYLGVLTPDHIVIVLKEKGVAEYYALGMPQKLVGTWAIKDGAIEININDEPAPFVIKNNCLVLEFDGEYQVYDYYGDIAYEGGDNSGSEGGKPGTSEPGQKPDVDDGKVEGGDTSCEHTWETVSLNDGVMTSVCHDCKATKTQDKTELYQYVTKSIFLSIEELASRESSNKPFSVKGNKDEYVWMDASWENQGMQVKGVVSFVHMLAQMMVNPQFNITNAPVKFAYSYAGLNETGKAILMYNFDEKNDKVTMYWDVASNMNGNEMKIFLFLDVDYDFANYALKGFEIQTTQSMGDESICLGFRYNDQEFKMTVDPNFASQVNATATELQAHYDEIIDLEADFTKEYTEMMDYMNGSMGDNDPDEPSDNPGFNPGDMGFEIGTEDWFWTVLCADKWDVRLTITQTVVDSYTAQNSVSEFVISRGNIIGKQTVEGRQMYVCYLQTSDGIRLFNSADGKEWVEFNLEQNGGMSADAMYGQTMYMCIPSTMIMGLVDFNSIFFNEDFTQAKMPEEFLSTFAFSDFMLTFENGRLASWTYSQQQGSFAISYYITYDYENVEMDVELPKYEGGNQGGGVGGGEIGGGNGNVGEDDFNQGDKPIPTPKPENPNYPNQGGDQPNPGYQEIYTVLSVDANGKQYNLGDVFEDGSEIGEYWAMLELWGAGNFYLTFNQTHYEGFWKQDGDSISLYYVDNYGYQTSSYATINENKEIILHVDNNTITFKFLYRAGDDVDNGGGEDLPPEGGDVEIIEKQDYKFKFVSFSYGGRTYYPGDKYVSVSVTEDFATLVLKQDYSAEMIANGGVSTGSWRIWAGDLFATLTDSRRTYDFQIKYYGETNTIGFHVSGFDYEFAMPDGVVFDQILGDIPGCQAFTLNKIVAEGNEWTVGSEFNGGILTPESAMLIVYQDFTFKFINPQMSTIYGFLTQNQDGGILLTYDDTETIPLFMEGNGAIIYFSLDGFVTYYFNGSSYQDGNNQELPPAESTPDLNINMPRVLRVGICPDHYPFGYYEEGKLVGFDVDFTKELAIALGYSLDNVEFVVVGEFDTLFSRLNNGEFDVIISAVMKTEPREEVAFSSDSYVSFQATYENEAGEKVTENEDYVVYGTSFLVIDYINGAIQTLNNKGVIDELAAKWLK